MSSPYRMIALEFVCDENRKDLLIADLWEERCAGITELEGGLMAFFKDADRGAGLLERFAAHHPRLRTIEDEDWLAVARGQIEPMMVGARFFICPEWLDDPTPEQRIRINVNPGLAFGTGSHETTQLCLEALERHVSPGISVLDVGTGSGILCESARKLGAALAVGCDNDPEAAVIARERGNSTYIGSVDSVSAARFDLIVANIAAPPIIELAAELKRCLRVPGTLLLSGFEEDDIPRVLAAFPGSSSHVREKNAWRLVEVTYA